MLNVGGISSKDPIPFFALESSWISAELLVTLKGNVSLLPVTTGPQTFEPERLGELTTMPRREKSVYCTLKQSTSQLIISVNKLQGENKTKPEGKTSKHQNKENVVLWEEALFSLLIVEPCCFL